MHFTNGDLVVIVNLIQGDDTDPYITPFVLAKRGCIGTFVGRVNENGMEFARVQFYPLMDEPPAGTRPDTYGRTLFRPRWIRNPCIDDIVGNARYLHDVMFRALASRFHVGATVLTSAGQRAIVRDIDTDAFILMVRDVDDTTGPVLRRVSMLDAKPVLHLASDGPTELYPDDGAFCFRTTK